MVGLLMSLWAFVLTVMEVVGAPPTATLLARAGPPPRTQPLGNGRRPCGAGGHRHWHRLQSNYSIERDVQMKPGDSVDIHQYHFVFRDVRDITGPNYFGGEGVIEVSQNSHHVVRCGRRNAFTAAAGWR